MWKYDQALGAIREIVKKSGREPKDFALHSLRIGGASTLAAGGDVSERVIQQEGRWKGESVVQTYTKYNNTLPASCGRGGSQDSGEERRADQSAWHRYEGHDAALTCCGVDGEGYRFRETRWWVKKNSPVLQVR